MSLRDRLALAWFPRLVLLILTPLLGIVALFLVVIRAANPHPSCLKIEFGVTVTYIDPRTSATYAINFTKREKPFALPDIRFASAFSPDGTHLAYFHDLHRDGLRVVEFSLPQMATLRRPSHNFPPDTGDLLWSPDGRWVAYLWNENNIWYLAIADADGNQQNTTTLNTTEEQWVSLDSWSADSTYLSLITITGDYENTAMSFISAPHLKISEKREKVSRTGCDGPQSIDARIFCRPWTSVGHRAAYVVSGHGFDRLIIVDVGDAVRATFWLPNAQMRTIQTSPTGDCVAIGSYVFPEIGPLISDDGQLNIYCVDGERLHLGSVKFLGIGAVEGGALAQMNWSSDGKTLFYARRNPIAPSDQELMMYHPADHTYRSLFAMSEKYTLDFSVARDGQTLAVYRLRGSSDLESAFQIIDLSGKKSPLRSGNFDCFDSPWSPDSALFAFSDYDKQIGTIIKIADREGNVFSQVNSPIDSVRWAGCDGS